MKKAKVLAILLALVFVFTACGQTTPVSDNGDGFKGGTYTATAEGYNKSTPIEVEVTISDSKEITDIVIKNHAETEGIGAEALKQLPEKMVESNSIEVDDMSTATVTSQALKSAIEDALNQAGLNPNDLQKKETANDDVGEQIIDTDVVVVGAGGAGMTAALEAHNNGAKVVVLEKAAITGGNTVKATGGMNASGTDVQDEDEFTPELEQTIRENIEKARTEYPDLTELADTVERQLDEFMQNPEGYFDTAELFELDTLVGGRDINNKELVKTLAENSDDGIEWLKENGMDLNTTGYLGGASVERAHKPLVDGKTLSVGSFLVPKLTELLQDKEIEIIYDTEVKEILVEDGAAVGVKADNVTVNAKSVIIATGGFGANLDKIVELKAELEGFVTTNAPTVTGDGIFMAEDIGAATVDMEQIQIHPTVEQETSSLITESVRGDGAILINQDGKRFTDEVGTRDKVSADEIAQPGGYAYLIFDQNMADKSSPLQGYIEKGFTKEGQTYEELAGQIDVDPQTLVETMNTWNEAVRSKDDTEFGRTAFTETLETAPFYAIKLSPGIHHTMGGLVINSESQVLDQNNEPIKNLYAAGEVTGGVHGANRLGGNAVADIVVFGRIAGENAAKNAGN